MKLPIPDDWNGEEWCRYAICWPNSEKWLAILRGFITLPQRGRTWDERTGSIIDVQLIGREITAKSLPEKEVIMACGDEGLSEIAIAIQALADATATANSSGCCDDKGSGGAGNTDVEFSENEEGNPNVDPPPDGYDSWEEFYNQKCFIARDIVNKIQSDLGNLALANFGNISLSGLAALVALAFATPIPFDDIIAIAGLLLAVVAEIVIATTLSLVNDNEEELICELYNGTNASDSRNRFLSRFSDIVDSGVADPVEATAIKAIMGYMLNPTNVNRLYVKDNTLVFPSDDCSCEFCEVLTWEFLEDSPEGWSATTAMPDCFGLADPPLCSFVIESEIMTLTGAAQGNSYKGAIFVEDIEFLATSGWNFQIRIHKQNTQALYIDLVATADDGTCGWVTIDNNFTNDLFTVLETTIPELDGKTIVSLHLYISGHIDDPTMQAVIDYMVLNC